MDGGADEPKGLQQHRAPQPLPEVKTSGALAASPTTAGPAAAAAPPISVPQSRLYANRDGHLGSRHVAAAAAELPETAAAAETPATAAEVLHEQQHPPAEAGAAAQLPLDLDSRVRSDYGQLKVSWHSADGRNFEARRSSVSAADWRRTFSAY